MTVEASVQYISKSSHSPTTRFSLAGIKIYSLINDICASFSAVVKLIDAGFNGKLSLAVPKTGCITDYSITFLFLELLVFTI